MKILITSGGTKVPIDAVRDITNMSHGTFGSKIATELLHAGHEVIFLRAKESKSPFSLTVDLVNQPYQEACLEQQLQWLLEFFKKCGPHYHEVQYRNFEDYAAILERSIKIHQPAVVVLAAAASDYGTTATQGKIRCKEGFAVPLTPLPKLISQVKGWLPTTKLVGFKLLVDSAGYKLIAAAKESITANQCDLVVANSLDDIKDNKHRLYLVRPDGTHTTYCTDPNNPNYLARVVAQAATTL